MCVFVTFCFWAGAFARVITSPALGDNATQTNSANYAAQAEHLVEDLAASDFAAVEDRFEEQMAKDLPREKLSALWKEFTAEAGPFERIVAKEVSTEFDVYHAVTMTCAFQRAQQADALVVFGQGGRVAGLYFGPQPTETVEGWTTPSYAHPGRFREDAVVVSHGPWHLPGTLTLPEGSGPFPAVVLVPGSPPLDQDATVGTASKIFKDFAWGLASRGIASLRYTKRAHQFGAGLGGGNGSSFTLRDELIDDVCAALALLAARGDIDHQQTYLLGHSLGGLAVPQIAAGDPRIAGIVVMGTPSGDLLNALLSRLEGGQMGEAGYKMVPVFKQIQKGDRPAGEILDFFGNRSPVGYWLDMRKYQPGITAAKLKCRVMVLVGGHDAEVPPDTYEAWQSALAGRANANVKFYPTLFHLFMPSTATEKGKDLPDDWGRPGHVAPEVVDDIASWILSKN